MNEKGAILPSIIVFVFLLVVILLGSVSIYHDQMHQLFATKESYNAKGMLLLTEEELRMKLNNSELIETGKATFKNGEVTVKKMSTNLYQLTAVTNKQFSMTKQMKYVVPKKQLEQKEEAKPVESESVEIERPVNLIDQTDEIQKNQLTP